MLVLLMLVVCAIGLIVKHFDGFEIHRGPWPIVETSERPPLSELQTKACISRYQKYFLPRFISSRDMCVQSSGDTEVLVIGDSHAQRLFSGLTRATDTSVMLLGRRSCLPVLYADGERNGKPLKCAEGMRGIVRAVEDTNAETIVLHGYFSRPYWSEPEPDVLVDISQGLSEILIELKSLEREVILMLGVPELDFHPTKCIRRPFQLEHIDCILPIEKYNKQRSKYISTLYAVLKNHPDVRVFDPMPFLCDKENCALEVNGELLYNDTNHLSLKGAEIVSLGLHDFLNHE